MATSDVAVIPATSAYVTFGDLHLHTRVHPKREYRDCFGSCNKPPLIVAVDEPSEGLRIQCRLMKKLSVANDFWSLSTCEMDNSTMRSHRSVSSISFTNNTATSTSSGNPNEFVNNGLNLWNQTRQQWHANGSSQIQAKL